MCEYCMRVVMSKTLTPALLFLKATSQSNSSLVAMWVVKPGFDVVPHVKVVWMIFGESVCWVCYVKCKFKWRSTGVFKMMLLKPPTTHLKPKNSVVTDNGLGRWDKKLTAGVNFSLRCMDSQRFTKCFREKKDLVHFTPTIYNIKPQSQ